MSFKPGDQVAHKSDPTNPMTVVTVDRNQVHCSWRTKRKPCKATFTAAEIERYNPPLPFGFNPDDGGPFFS